MTRGLIATLAVAGCLTSAALAEPIRPRPGSIVEGTRYDCPDIAEAAPATAFFDKPVYQGEDGWFFRLDSDVTDFTQQAPQVLDMVARLAATLKARGVGLVYVPVPTRAMTGTAWMPKGMDDGLIYDEVLASDQYKAMVSKLRRLGVTTADLLSTIEASDTKDFHFPRDTHWQPEGARLAARTVAVTVEAANFLKGVPRSAYTSTHDGEANLVSPMGRALQDLCVDALDPQTYNVWSTSKAEVTADDLLGGGDETSDVAPVAIVGTSFSDLKALNFGGFLSEAMGVDLANWAISSGGTYTSMLDWSHSASMDGALPKVLVWENPVAYRLNAGGVAALRQVIPAIKGACGDAALFAAALRVEPGKSATIAVPPSVSVSGHDAWLAIHMSDPTVRNFRISLETRDGDGEDFAISRPPRMANTDRAFLELSDDIPGALAAVTIAAPVAGPTEFQLQVCQSKGA